MLMSRIRQAQAALAFAAVAACPVFAQEAAVPSPARVPAPQAAPQSPPWVPADFPVPTRVEGPGFKLVPLGPDVVSIDFDAYMSSIEHLQRTFSRSPTWPHRGITAADALQDMLSEQARFTSRQSFAYAVLTPDGRRERGSVYVSPSPVNGYDALVRMWVTKSDYDAGFDAELYRWITGWIETEWPFRRAAYPGRAIEWEKWDALVATKTKRPQSRPS